MAQVDGAYVYLGSADAQWHIASNIEFDTGTTIDRISVNHWDDDLVYAGDDVIVADGYDRIPERMLQAAGLAATLNQRVTKVDYSGERVVVTTAAGLSYTAGTSTD